MTLHYTPECSECGIPSDDCARDADGWARCAECRRGRYGLILADPPWGGESGGGRSRRGADRHYPLLPTGVIQNLPVSDWAARDAFLFLWATVSTLPDALSTMEFWGFRYVTSGVWVKERPGLGHYLRMRHEYLLIGKRGSPAYSRRPGGGSLPGRNAPESVITAARRAHSVKPEAAYAWAETFSPGPFLEMFARRLRPGWDSWGNEIPEGYTKGWWG